MILSSWTGLVNFNTLVKQTYKRLEFENPKKILKEKNNFSKKQREFIESYSSASKNLLCIVCS